MTQRKHIWVKLKVEGEDFADDEDLDLRDVLEEQIEERGIGYPTGAGSGMGWMDFSFEVENEAAVQPAINAIKELLEELGVTGPVQFEVYDR